MRTHARKRTQQLFDGCCFVAMEQHEGSGSGDGDGVPPVDAAAAGPGESAVLDVTTTVLCRPPLLPRP